MPLCIEETSADAWLDAHAHDCINKHWNDMYMNCNN